MHAKKNDPAIQSLDVRVRAKENISRNETILAGSSFFEASGGTACSSIIVMPSTVVDYKVIITYLVYV